MLQPSQSGAAVKNRPTVTTKVAMGQLAIGSTVENIAIFHSGTHGSENHWLRQQQENCAHPKSKKSTAVSLANSPKMIRTTFVV
jgi:hypothetical protein